MNFQLITSILEIVVVHNTTPQNRFVRWWLPPLINSIFWGWEISNLVAYFLSLNPKIAVSNPKIVDPILFHWLRREVVMREIDETKLGKREIS